MDLKDIISDRVAQYLGVVKNVRRFIHRNPELSFQEMNTAKYIKSVLADYGIETTPLNSYHSFIATVSGGTPGKTLALRAELDALPIQEETGLDFASATPGVMHACGHDLHMALAVGTAIILNELKDYWSGTLVLVFESGEELLPGGAMGILDSPEFRAISPDAMIGVHVLPELMAGKVGFCSGRYMASGDEVYLTVKGKGGHAALPHTLVDPVVIASSLILNLQSLVSRNAPALVPTVLSFGKVEAKGATNIIPDEVTMAGTFRTMDEEWRGRACGLITEIAQGVARSMGAGCAVDIRKGYPSVYNNPNFTTVLKAIAIDVLGEDNVIDLEPRMTTDDFAYFSQQIPSVFFRIGIGGESDTRQLHTSAMLVDEGSIKTGLQLLVHMVCRTLRPDECC